MTPKHIKHSLSLTSLQVSWVVLQIWARFGWFGLGSNASAVSWQGGWGRASLAQPHSHVWLFTTATEKGSKEQLEGFRIFGNLLRAGIYYFFHIRLANRSHKASPSDLRGRWIKSTSWWEKQKSQMAQVWSTWKDKRVGTHCSKSTQNK